MPKTDFLDTARSLLDGDDQPIELPDSITSRLGSPSSDSSNRFPALSEMDMAPSDALVELGMTPDQYIQKALAAHGGRLRQQAICELTGWSDGTVSQTLGNMEDDGEIVRFRDGREKIVCLPEHGPPSKKTPAKEARTASSARKVSVTEPVSHD